MNVDQHCYAEQVGLDVTHSTYMGEVPGSNLDRDANCPD
jgi:hypothetical protein